MHRVAGLGFRKDGFHIAGPAVTLAPFASFAPHLATLDLDHHDSACRVEKDEITLSLGTEASSEGSRVARMHPPKGVDDNYIVRKRPKCPEHTFLTGASVEIARSRRNHPCHREFCRCFPLFRDFNYGQRCFDLTTCRYGQKGLTATSSCSSNSRLGVIMIASRTGTA